MSLKIALKTRCQIYPFSQARVPATTYNRLSSRRGKLSAHNLTLDSILVYHHHQDSERDKRKMRRKEDKKTEKGEPNIKS